MNLRSPMVAMLWENWRLTRVEAGQRLALGLVVGTGALTLSAAGPAIAFWFLIVLHGMFIWLSIAKLNGGRLSDGYKPGFPFHLLFARPIPTVMFVGVAVAYDAISCAALYIVSAALLNLAFGASLPLFSLALWIVAFHLAYCCIQWATRSRTVQWVGSIATLPLFLLLQSRAATSLQVEFSLAENAMMALACVVLFALTVAGVSRQRRGDAVATVTPQKEGSDTYPAWLVTLFRFRCPTSSATRAQLWFELKSSGLPVLTIGLVVAALIFVLFASSIPFASLRYVAVSLTVLCVPVLVFALGGNAFGIRRKQGRTYASPFELIQPNGTAQLASVKVMARTACVLVALAAIGVSVAASSALLSAWGEWVPAGGQNVLPGMLTLRQKVADQLAALTGYSYVAIVVVACIVVATLVTWQAAREALQTRYRRMLFVVQWLPAVWGLAMILLTLAIRKGLGPTHLVGEIVTVSFWMSGAAMLLATIYLFWRGFAERALTARYACGALAIAAVFFAAWRAGMPAAEAVGILWLALAVLMVGVLAPWAFHRVRHA
jgi:hypothetical protein